MTDHRPDPSEMSREELIYEVKKHRAARAHIINELRRKCVIAQAHIEDVFLEMEKGLPNG